MSIKLLQSRVISQIAAGEVVERPASVVKELIENAIDASANQISVEIRGGGIDTIRVTDNGIGIPDEESELAFARHATSKIENLQDIENLHTLGFRGEALPSIASVAQVQMLTRHREAKIGTFLSIYESSIVKHEPQARIQGTTITVQNLFRKIPARLKFLKSVRAETAKITDIVTRYALAYPEIRLTYVIDGKTKLHTQLNGKLIDSLAAVYGADIAADMLEVNSIYENDDANGKIEVTGMIGSPRISRSNRDDITFFINRRWINNRMLTFAFEEAYHGLLMQDKHPIGVINISINPALIDVNVHPAKTEVKFENDRIVFSAVQRAVRQVLIQSAPVPHVEEVRHQYNVSSPNQAYETSEPEFKQEFTETPVAVPPHHPTYQTGATPLFTLPLLRVIGQFAKNYIIAEGPEGLFLIDQHAAHERIMFEKIKKQRSSRAVETQSLLEPAVFEPGLKMADLLSEHLQELAEFGFTIESFGDKTFLVRTIPAILRGRDWQSVLREIISEPVSDWTENIISRMACHSAVRSGKILSDEEMKELIRQMEQADIPNTCPHGRPTIIQIGLKQIEREFGRT
jgi:DNA mismatch repair protein MutL